MSLWPGAKLPDLTGKTAIVTGANSGIGLYTALELAIAGADVTLACRSAERGEAAAALVNAQAPGKARFAALDLADFNSVRAFAAGVKAESGALDLLINNAGVMAPKHRQTTAQGYERQFGVNFLGHFLLTALLLDQLMSAKSPRVVQLASIAHKQGQIDFADPQAENSYVPWRSYRQSKLAMLIFALELAKRSQAGGWGITSVAAHPGIAATALVKNGPGLSSLMAIGMQIGKAFVVQSAEAGAWPTILAATDTDAKQGAYYGPQGFQDCRGLPGLAKISPQALAPETGTKLWALAEQLTGETLKPAQ
jgi:NAD(P)-dependent dehydrogenase (short-subunit alcohol dehydrogenase family)